MSCKATFRKLTTALLAVSIVLWATAGLALVQGDQVMQCSMSMHARTSANDMGCCPGDEMLSPANQRPQCCEVSQQPEAPLGFVVTAKQVNPASLDVVAVLPATFAAPAANHFGVWRSADAPRFVKPVLELKTDLRI